MSLVYPYNHLSLMLRINRMAFSLTKKIVEVDHILEDIKIGYQSNLVFLLNPIITRLLLLLLLLLFLFLLLLLYYII